MVWWTSFAFGAAFLIPALWIQLTNAGNTTCASSQLDWYTSVVGESPCITYQRLRQICNSDYQVPNFRPNTPGDQCDDQVSACCCNTVAFQLSMLCMNCQYDTQPGEQAGIDAGIGAYTLYRETCGAGTNNSLSNDIQSAVCNLDIRLDNFVYGGWADGSWFYVWTKENAERDHAANNNNTFTHCANQISPSPTPTPTPPSTSTIAHATTTTSTQTSSSTTVPVATATDNGGGGSTPTSNLITTDAPSSTSTAVDSPSSTSNAANPPPSSKAVDVPRPSGNSANALSLGSNSADASSFNSQAADATVTISLQSDSSAGVPVPTAADNVGGGSDGSHSHVGAIAGGVVGGVCVIAIIGGAIIWRMRRKPTSTMPAMQDRHYSVMYQDNPSAGPSTSFATGMAAVSTEEQTLSLARDATVTGPRPGSGAAPPWTRGSTSFDPFSAVFPDDSLRHNDGGPVVELIRSSSGRLPPAYREAVRNARSNAGSASVADTGSGSGESEYSETQPFRALAPTVPDSVTSPSSTEPDPYMPLIPRRLSMKEQPS